MGRTKRREGKHSKGENKNKEKIRGEWMEEKNNDTKTGKQRKEE